LALNIQISHTPGVSLDVGLAGWDFIAHQDVKYAVGSGGIVYGYFK
jgi:hypothetical protein